MFAEVGDALIAARTNAADPFAALDAILSWTDFETSIAEAKSLVRGEGHDYGALAEANHALLRRIGPALLGAFIFEGVAAASDILNAVAMLRSFYAGPRKALPKGMPTSFVRRV